MSPREASSLRQNLRLWWTFWGQGAGMIVGVVAILCIGFLVIPRGQSAVKTGVVTALYGETFKAGTRVYANVAVAGRPVRVQLYAGNDCVIGSPIVLQKVRTVVGQRYVAQERGCRATPSSR